MYPPVVVEVELKEPNDETLPVVVVVDGMYADLLCLQR
jgi:hypothetical protein